MPNQINQEFARLREEKRAGFIPFITAGDPNLSITIELVIEFAKLGVTAVELGVPFSDPVADGATIQRSAERALAQKTNLAGILQAVAEIRRRNCQVPIVLFSYFNPLLQFGLEKLATRAAQAGVDGVLVTDVVPEESGEFRGLLTRNNSRLITLAAPTSSDARLEKIARAASGFVYAVARTGVTGARANLDVSAEKLVERLRRFTDLPIAVGFGISTKEQATAVCRYADAAIVGSAIVAEMTRLAPSLDDVPSDFVENIKEFTRSLLPENL